MRRLVFYDQFMLRARRRVIQGFDPFRKAGSSCGRYCYPTSNRGIINKYMTTEYDVLVIGAGVAGLNAGRLLAGAGRRVAILEARNRIGGRIWTKLPALDRLQPPEAVELGAEFVHGLPQETWSLVRQAGLSTFEIDGSSFWFDGSRLMAANQQRGAAESVLEDLGQWMQKQPRDTDMSFSEYLNGRNVDPLAAKAAGNYVEGFNAADQHYISVAALAKQQAAEDAIAADRLFRIEGGYAAVPNFLAEKFTGAGGRLILGAPVRKISWNRGGVLVETAAAEGDLRFHSRRAVITVPLGVLQAQTIEFVPPPADVLAHANRLKMGAAVHLTFAFTEKFWDPNLSFLFAPGESPATWWTPMPHEAAMVTAWAGGPKAELLLKLITADGDASALRDRCLATLSKIFARPLSDIRQLLSSWHMHDWQSDQYSRGAYSYVQAGALDAPEKMRIPVEDTLHFAGEHTDVSGHWGTVHAALASGASVADQIISGDGSRRGP
jgi:monoamine oxidase